MKNIVFVLFALFTTHLLLAQKIDVPKSHSNIAYKNGRLQFFDKTNNKWVEEVNKTPKFTYSKIVKDPIGTETGIRFDFQDPTFEGTLYYGLIKLDSIKFPQPVFFKKNAEIKGGKAHINIIKRLSGKYDFVNWEETGKMVLGYRIVDASGLMIYDGKINLKGKGPFTPDITILEGPFVTLQTDRGVSISFKTNHEAICSVLVNNKEYKDETPTKNHLIHIKDLEPYSEYTYTVQYGEWKETYSFKTARQKGSRQPFTWAYASDSRSGSGGGEREIYGTNYYIVKKMMTLAKARNADFFQFTGDMINGYTINPDQTNLEYINYKHAIEFMGRYAPVNVAMGNHEVIMRGFEGRSSVDRFPYDQCSAEKIFADNFVNPLNGPEGEDGASYDPSARTTDFPSYKENAYYYTYGNMAMIVMNSNYWYAPSGKIPEHSGNFHGYIMDNQLQWLKETVDKFEKDDDIDHIFVTLHTPAFPNGGHSKDDMWYGGNNATRAYVAGKALDKGIIERRDEILDILINQSKKCVMMLNGDEHNYNRMLIDSTMNMYPKDWDKPKLKISRPFIQITNGAAGAPYYAQEVLPWSDHVKTFSTLNALMFFTIDGPKIYLEVVNPDTFELIEKICVK